MFYFIVVEACILVVLVYMLFCIIFYSNVFCAELISCYECGFDPKSITRLVFSYKFFLISILFIVFDVEISLMVSMPFFMVSGVSLLVFLLFMFILIVGLLYEYYYGSLDWLQYFK